MQGKRKFQTLKDFVENLHKEGTGLLNYDGNNVPCIYVDSKRYENIISSTYGKKLAVDTLLNIFHDGTHVFVDIQMKFLDSNREEYFLVFANEMLEFFEALSKTGLIAIVPQMEYYGNQNIFVIQIPKIESAEKAFEIIKSNAKK
ncbi:MAG: hypothetical protein WBM37_06425 [Nitrososphaeraceae archaeon]